MTPLMDASDAGSPPDATGAAVAGERDEAPDLPSRTRRLLDLIALGERAGVPF